MSAWVEAVEAMRKARLLSAASPECDCRWMGTMDDNDASEELFAICPFCYDAMLRAALPHLLRAVCDAVDVSALRTRMVVADLSLYHKDREGHSRTALLAALTDAAGRVGS